MGVSKTGYESRKEVHLIQGLGAGKCQLNTDLRLKKREACSRWNQVCWGGRLETTPPSNSVVSHSMETNPLKHTSCFIFYKILLMCCFIFSLPQTFQMSLAHAIQSGKDKELSPLFLGCKKCYSRKHGYSRVVFQMLDSHWEWLRTLSVWLTS